ncbi:MAG: DNA/RNA non-specific endonuclease [Spirochaetota bacterium]
MKRALFFTTLAAALMLALPQDASGQSLREIHSEHFWMGMPLGADATNDLIIRDLYAACTNDTTKFADWVAYRLTPKEVLGSLDLERRWRADPWLEPSETLEPYGPDDYAGAYGALGYDRGHLAPLGSFTGSTEASSVNYYSNIVPQTRELNRGPWRVLEEEVRALVMAHGEVFVVTGCLYDGAPMPSLPEADESHTVPTGFFKVVVVPDAGGGSPEIRAYAMPQRLGSGDAPENYRTTVDEVERRSGLDLFWRLEDAVEASLEASAE